MVLDSDENPQYIDFYQVKTNAAAAGWKRNQLYQVAKKKTQELTVEPTLFDEEEEEVEADEKYSKIAKLLIHSLDFPDNARDFFFVTNANFGGTLVKGTKLSKAKELDFSDLIEKAKEEIQKKVKEELPELDESVFEHLHFIKNQMSIDDHEATMIGLLTNFLNEHLSMAKVAVRPVYDTLIGEIRRRNDYEIEPNSKEDLLKKKAFTKTQFHNFLKGLETYQDIEAKKASVQSILQQFLPAKDAAKRRSILRNMNSIKEDFLIYDNHEFLRLYSSIDILIEKTKGEYDEWEWSQKVLEQLKNDESFSMRYSDDYLTCLILYEMCE